MARIKIILSTALLAVVLVLQAQTNNEHSLSLGFSFGAGKASTKTATLIDAFEPLQVANKFVNSWAPSMYLEQRFFNSFAVQLGASYINNTYSYMDQTTTNNGSGNAVTEEYTVSSKMKYLQTNLGVSKIFFSDATVRPFIGVHFNLSFSESDSIDFRDNTAKSTHQTLVGFNPSPVFGFTPEIGVKLGEPGRGNWVFSMKFHQSSSETMSGEYASYNNNFTDANYSSINTSGDFVHFNIGYEFPLKKWDPKDKMDKKADKDRKAQNKQVETQRKEEEKARLKAEKEEGERVKSEAKALAKQQEVEKNKEELKTDASGTPKELEGRKISVQQEFEVATSEIKLEIWDDGAEIDGDSIKIYFNGEWIVTDFGLTKEKQFITLQLNEKGKNYLIVYAINEGVHPPNTAAVSFFNGEKEVRFRVHSKMDESGAVSFKFKQP